MFSADASRISEDGDAVLRLSARAAAFEEQLRGATEDRDAARARAAELETEVERLRRLSRSSASSGDAPLQPPKPSPELSAELEASLLTSLRAAKDTGARLRKSSRREAQRATATAAVTAAVASAQAARNVAIVTDTLERKRLQRSARRGRRSRLDDACARAEGALRGARDISAGTPAAAERRGNPAAASSGDAADGFAMLCSKGAERVDDEARLDAMRERC